MDPKPYKLAKLNDKGGIIKEGKANRWYIEYHVFDETKNKLVRRRDYKINQFESYEERHQYFRQYKKKVDSFLQDGYYLKSDNSRTIFQTLDEILEIKKQTLRPRTFQSYSSTVSRYKEVMEDKILTNVKVLDIIKFQDFLVKKIKNVSVNSALGHISALLSEAVKRGYLDENPCSKVPKLKEEVSYKNQALPKKQQKRILQLAKKDPQLYLAIRLLYYCFIRVNEIRQLQISNFDLHNQQIFIPSSVSKNGKAEHVTIPNHFNEQLIEELNPRAKHEYLMSTNGGVSPFSMNVLASRHRRILEELDLYGQYTLYSWKHTGVVEAYRNGVDIKSIQLQCRHHSVGMTDIYLKSLGLYLNKAILQNMPNLE